MQIIKSGLPILIDEKTHNLEFLDGLTCAGSVKKQAGQLKGLLYANEIFNEQEKCYEAYRDIVFDKDRPLFQKYDFRYDITVIMPGTIQGECKKTSGHYHGYINGQPYTYPEVYEVLAGKAMYILQKSTNFDHENEEPVIQDLKAVVVEAGQAIAIPPFYGHCSINVGNGPLVFSNLAVVSCPLHYTPIQKKQGLSLYVLKNDNEPEIIPNRNYLDVPEFRVVFPKEEPALGITFGTPVYGAFVNDPEKFDFLLHPAQYVDEMTYMLT
jgi:glucose-6-phosphate isomerase, archaeal